MPEYPKVESETQGPPAPPKLVSVKNKEDEDSSGEPPQEIALDEFTNSQIFKPAQSMPTIDVAEDNDYIVRRYNRYSKKLDVSIQCDGKVFQTTSKDISIGGVMVADPVPEWVVGYCKVILKNSSGKESVSLTCYLVENQDPKSRFRLAFLPLQDKGQEQQLEDWILAA